MTEIHVNSRTYRDVTISKHTRDQLEEILAWLDVERPDEQVWLWALGSTIDRWDANEATEVEL